MTEQELQVRCQALQEELDKYNITYDENTYCKSCYDNLYKFLVREYNDDHYGCPEVFKKYYTFEEFALYVPQQTIAQGYIHTIDFVRDLWSFLLLADQRNETIDRFTPSLKLHCDLLDTRRLHLIKKAEV